MASLRNQVRRFPPIAWRDRRIAELVRKERQLREQLEQATASTRRLEKELTRLRQPPKYSPTEPSWHWRIQEQARVGRGLRRIDTEGEYPRRRLLQKLHNYELARSYGVATPRVIGRWERIEDVDWDGLPDRFVLKSNRGYSANGVLPLRRSGEGFRLIDGDRELLPDDVVAHFAGAREVSGPYFAEELIPGTAEVLPDDVKIFAFYGTITDVMVRRVSQHGDLGSFSYRYVDAEGKDLGRVRTRAQHDSTIEVPRDLTAMCDVARVLSRAVPVPFVRVDLYQVPDGVMLGELTPLPGASGSFTTKHDRYLGAMYDDAEGRLNLDLARGRSFAVTFGPHSRDLTTPMTGTVRLPG